MLRSLYSASLYARGDLRFDLGGITASIPLASIKRDELVGIVSLVRHHILSLQSCYQLVLLRNVMFFTTSYGVF